MFHLFILSFLYAVIRPAEIVRSLSPNSDSNPTPTLVNIQSEEDGRIDSKNGNGKQQVSKKSSIHRPVTVDDLSNLIVAALREDKLRKTTVFCESEAAGKQGASGFQDWKQAIAASNVSHTHHHHYRLLICIRVYLYSCGQM